MPAHLHRRALWLLLPANSVALGVAVAVAQGAVALPAPPSPLVAPAPTAVAPLLTPRSTPVEPREERPRPAPPSRVAVTHPAPPPKQAAPRRVARRTTPVRRAVPRRTFEQELQRQVARIPLYRPGLARWVVVPDLAVYGVTSLRTRTVYLSPRVPRKLLYSVVVHEWGHVISTQAYGGNLRVSQQAFKEWFGGGSMKVATERAGDCIAVLLGATWTHYTSCRNEHWRLGALYLANGMRLPDRS